MSIIFWTLIGLFIAWCLLAAVRNHIVYRILNRRIDTRAARARLLYRAGLPFDYLFADPVVTYQAYTAMMWDLSKWTYEDFYGKD